MVNSLPLIFKADEEIEDTIKYLTNMDMFNKITNCAETFAQCFYEPRDEENRTFIRQIDKSPPFQQNKPSTHPFCVYFQFKTV